MYLTLNLTIDLSLDENLYRKNKTHYFQNINDMVSPEEKHHKINL